LTGSISFVCQAEPVFPTRIVVLESMIAPGTDGATYQVFGQGDIQGPKINSAGDIAFRATLSGGGLTQFNNTGLWGTSGAVLGLIAREGNEAAGTSGNTFNEFVTPLNEPVLSDSGLVLFVTELQNAPGIDISRNQRGLWSLDQGIHSLVARQGDAAPGADGAEFNNFDRPVANDLGQFVFKGALQNTTSGDPGVVPGTRLGIWVERGSGLELAGRNGSVAPDTEGATFNDFADSPTINSLGTVPILASLVIGTGGVDATNNQGIWLNRSNSLELLVRTGQTAPETAGGRYLGIGAIELNNNDEVAFRAQLASGPGGVTPANDTGIWVHSAQTSRLVAREGETAPGTDNARFGSFGFLPVAFNDAGDIALSASLVQNIGGVTDESDTGIWTSQGNQLTLLAREGSDAPGTQGADFDEFRSEPIMNNRGDIAFLATLERNENGVDNSNRLGIWAYSAALGDLFLLARTGDVYDVSLNQDGSDMRRIVSFTIDPSGLNDRGELAYRLAFEGAFDAIAIATIPPPATGALASLSLLALLRRRAR